MSALLTKERAPLKAERATEAEHELYSQLRASYTAVLQKQQAVDTESQRQALSSWHCRAYATHAQSPTLSTNYSTHMMQAACEQQQEWPPLSLGGRMVRAASFGRRSGFARLRSDPYPSPSPNPNPNPKASAKGPLAGGYAVGDKVLFTGKTNPNSSPTPNVNPKPNPHPNQVLFTGKTQSFGAQSHTVHTCQEGKVRAITLALALALALSLALALALALAPTPTPSP
eukprot:scaffold81130_cov60-Phaeocystis_antarctica.AAC.2